ncbi:MAG: hypothetical protein ABR980_07540 [Ignavibacteriaceae bacterium]|jgi:hypothetical protein
MKAKVKQFVENKTNELSYAGDNIAGKIEKPVKIVSISSAKRLLSKLIYKLQTGEVSGQNAKDMCYLLISYVNMVKDFELVKKIDEIEERLNNGK